MKVEASKAGKGAGMLAGAGVAGHLLLIFISLALMFGLSALFDMGLGWSALIVAVLWGIVAAVLAASGRKKLREVNPKPERTVETLKEDVQWAKTQSS
jgi:membrane protein implicated in regulation of membrane protease activity